MMIFNKKLFLRILKKLDEILKEQNKISERIDTLELAAGKLLINSNKNNFNHKSINNSEFKIYSQWGEDGIIQYLISKIPIKNKIFVEFGIQNYTESNTRFLLINDNWQGLILDGSEECINYVKLDSIYWKYNIKAVKAFVTKENINDLLLNNNIKGDIGILSIDIDGNDYWVWEAINAVSPRIVICEYNSLFGFKRKVTVPYDPNFIRSEKHHSNLYYGVSLAALDYLAQKKNYTLIASNSAGNNAFFVRNDLAGFIKDSDKKIEDIFIYANFRESRDNNGKLSYLSYNEAQELIKELPVFDVEKNALVILKDIF